MPSIWEPMSGKAISLIGVLTVLGLNVFMILTGYDVRTYSLLPYGLFFIYFGLQYWGVQTPYAGAPDTRSKKQIKRWRTLDRTVLIISSIYLFLHITYRWLKADASQKVSDGMLVPSPETMCTVIIVLISIAIVTRLLSHSYSNRKDGSQRTRKRS